MTEVELSKGTQRSVVTNWLELYTRPEQNTIIPVRLPIELETLEILQEVTAAKGTRGNLRDIAKSGAMMKKWYSLIDKVYAKENL